MYVKLIRDGHRSLYECDRVYFGKMVPGPDNTDVGAWLDLEGPDSQYIQLKFEKTDPSLIYVMNNNGHTIDRLFIKEIVTDALGKE